MGFWKPSTGPARPISVPAPRSAEVPGRLGGHRRSFCPRAGGSQVGPSWPCGFGGLVIHQAGGRGIPWSGLRLQVTWGAQRSRSSDEGEEGTIGRGCGCPQWPVISRLQDPPRAHRGPWQGGVSAEVEGPPLPVHSSSPAPPQTLALQGPALCFGLGANCAPSLSSPEAVCWWLQARGRQRPPSAEVQEEEAMLSAQL